MHGKVSDYGFNIRDLRRVIAVAEHRSVRRAALALEVDQGTLTRSIQALEHALRIPLFERMRTGARLTAAGVAFTKIAASVLDGMDGSSPETFDLALCWREGESDPVLARFIELARRTQEDDASFPGDV
ncbi:MAG: LysR family transcriptional regulator [Gluconobacter oxydans]|uniref:LysR family transcriptional regulator n=1 Tax=Gluconobacter oxydans TaxID=442 RepID=UPI0039EC30D0